MDAMRANFKRGAVLYRRDNGFFNFAARRRLEWAAIILRLALLLVLTRTLRLASGPWLTRRLRLSRLLPLLWLLLRELGEVLAGFLVAAATCLLQGSYLHLLQKTVGGSLRCKV
jgi:hypothetical protein